MATKNLLVRGLVVQSGESIDKNTGEIKSYTHVFEKASDPKYDSVVYRVEGCALPEGKQVVLEVEHVQGKTKEGGAYAFTRLKHDHTAILAANNGSEQKKSTPVPAGK